MFINCFFFFLAMIIYLLCGRTSHLQLGACEQVAQNLIA